VVIKGDREDQRDDKQHDQHTLVFRTDHQQTEEAKGQDHQFGYDHIRQNCAHEKPVFAFEKRLASWAMVPDMERTVYDRSLATGRTKQFETALQNPNSLVFIEFHDGARILRGDGHIQKSDP
jgi:hypothetical protein